MGGDTEVFFGGGGKVLGGKVQSPESRVQGPVLLLGYPSLVKLDEIDLIKRGFFVFKDSCQSRWRKA